MFKDELHIDLSNLLADLWVTKDGKQYRHLIDLHPKREFAILVTKTYEYIDGEFKCTGSISEQITHDTRNESWREETLIWLIRGLWGIPLKYTGKESD